MCRGNAEEKEIIKLVEIYWHWTTVFSLRFRQHLGRRRKGFRILNWYQNTKLWYCQGDFLFFVDRSKHQLEIPLMYQSITFLEVKRLFFTVLCERRIWAKIPSGEKCTKLLFISRCTITDGLFMGCTCCRGWH